jgi:hypothetical protein
MLTFVCALTGITALAIFLNSGIGRVNSEQPTLHERQLALRTTMATEEGPRHARITPDDHGAILSMTTWFLTCTLVLCTATRLIVRFTTQQRPSTDDVYIVIAAVSTSIPHIPTLLLDLARLKHDTETDLLRRYKLIANQSSRSLL